MQNEDLNITPDMLKNLSSMLGRAKSSNSINQDFDSANGSSKNTNTESANSSFNDMNIDFETILKIKSVVEKLNKKDDPRTNLLYSLKPYLNKSRQQKLDTYANILKISDIASLFKEQKKGDES